MAVLTGANGALKYEGKTVAKCRSWSLSVSRDALEDTCIGTDDRSYVKGLRGGSGSATVLYDPSDSAGVARCPLITSEVPDHSFFACFTRVSTFFAW